MIKSKHGRKSEAKANNPAPGCSGKKSPAPSEENDCEFPVLKMVDKRNLNCFYSIVARGKDEPVTMEELDRLQPELEMMLSNAAVRFKNLHSEVYKMSLKEDAKIDGKNLSSKKRKLSDSRMTNPTKVQPKVKEKDSGEKMEVSNSETETDNSAEVLFGSSLRESSNVPLPKNDVANKFWASVEPYAGDITMEGIKELEGMISVCDDDIAGVKIPPLGRHYSLKWAEEDMNQEKDASSLKPRRASVNSDTETKSLLKKANTLCSQETTSAPLVQRLVSALIEDQAPLQESYTNNKSGENNSTMLLSKLPTLHTSMCFERRVRRQLELSGVLEGSANSSTNEFDDTDEILLEIKKCDEELKSVASLNKNHLEQLLKMAHREIQRQEVRNKLKAIDTQLVEVYRKAVTAKLKKKELQRKEKDQAWKMLREREALLSRLEAI